MRKSSALLCACLLASSTASAQGTVWVVDDDGGAGVDFTLLQDAIDAAADGDVLLVKPGTYSPRPAFPPAPTIIDGKSLIVAAEAGPAPNIESLVVENLSAAQTVVLRGFRFDTPQVLVEDNAGVVWIEDCDFASPNFAGLANALQVNDNQAVHLNRCTSQGGMDIFDAGEALSANNSNVHLYDCMMTAAPAYTVVQDGGDGAQLNGGFLFASNTNFTGGSGDCGGNGLHIAGNAVTLGGSYAPGFTGGCVIGQPGVPIRVAIGRHTALSGATRSFNSTSPVRAGDTAVLTFTGQPGDLVFLGQADAPASLYVPNFKGVFQLAPVGYVSHFFGAMPPSGVMQINAPIAPMTTPSIVLYLQGATFSAGAGLTLAGGSSVLLLPN